MSRGKNLQEMETDTKQSKTAVNANAKPAEAPHTSATPVETPGQTGEWEDLGGPTPENYKVDDDSAKLKEPGATLSQVKDVVNAKAKAAEQMKSMKEESEEEEDSEEIGEEYDEEVEEESEGEEEIEEELESGEDSNSEIDEVFAQIDNEIAEDVSALLSDDSLSEEFKTKAQTIFEAALNARTHQIEEAIATQYEMKLAEEIEEIKEALVERVDSYLEYVAQEWIEENALQIEHGLKSEMTESFLSGMRGLFEEHYVAIPEERYDVIESMVEKLDEMETKLNEQIERNVSLNKRLAESVTEVIFAEVSEGLALSQKDKLASLAENVEFDSEEDYREKLVSLRESYFPRNTGAQRDDSDYISEDVDYYESVSGSQDSNNVKKCSSHLTLEDCLEIAVTNNPDIAQRQWDTKTALAEKDIAEGALWPEVHLEGGYTHFQEDRLIQPRRPGSFFTRDQLTLLLAQMVLLVSVVVQLQVVQLQVLILYLFH